MDRPFFDNRPGSDPTYEALRVPAHPNSVAARQYFDFLWSVAAPYVGADLQESARRQFHQVFWELYLATGLCHRGILLVRRAARGQRAAGPDFLQARPPVCYEAVAVTPGTGVDAVPAPLMGVAQDVPDAAISLRLTAGLFEKAKKCSAYRARGIIDLGIPCVIAINSGAVPRATLESSLPRIVRTVFPFGNEVLHLDLSSSQCVGHSYERREALLKHSGAPVTTSFFEQPDTRHVSAVLYSCADPFNCPQLPGDDFILIHNPHAANPLPRQHIPRAWEFWIDGDRLRSARRAGFG